jgi:hypothetical protein
LSELSAVFGAYTRQLVPQHKPLGRCDFAQS